MYGPSEVYEEFTVYDVHNMYRNGYTVKELAKMFAQHETRIRLLLAQHPFPDDLHRGHRMVREASGFKDWE